MKTVCIYHSIDLDGWMSAAIVKLALKDEPPVNFIGYNYGNPVPDLSEYDSIIMCDISFSKDHMFGLREKLGNKFIWIDHHISAIKDNESWMNPEPGFCRPVNGLQDTKYAACELTWKFFFPNDPMPEIVRLLGRYDCFGHKGTEEERRVLEFQYGARMIISNYKQAYDFLTSNLNIGNSVCDSIHIDGAAIYRYLCTEAKQSYKNGFPIYFELNPCDVNNNVKKFICINKERFNPINFGIDYHKDGYDGAACFHYANGMYNFSLYNDNGLVDCSVIAKQYGGGGHKGAAGFRLTQEQFNNLINK